MNKKFLAGIATGLAGALVIIALIFGAYTLGGRIGAAAEKGGNGSENNISANIPAQLPSQSQTKPSLGNEAASEQSDEAAELFNEKFQTINYLINNRFFNEVDADTIYEGMLYGLVASLGDPYSTYYSPEEYSSLLESTSGIYCGIGASVSQNMSTMIITVVNPFENCPAYNAGMLPGDIIVKVDGEDIVGQDLTGVVAKMKGEAGTQVVITVARENEPEYIDLTITRAKIETPYVTHRMLESNVGYISVSEFSETTTGQFRTALKDLEAQGMQGLVIDLRGNPGGLYDVVVDMLDILIENDRLLVYTEDKYGVREDQYSKTAEKFDKPLAVLIDGTSASASEIFSGALQDYGAATIVGTQSYGKGIVQSLYPINSDGSAVKLTVSQYFLPNGECIHGKGITPDIEVELDAELKQILASKREYDNQLDAAVQSVLDKMNK